jgi:hypothetical protein
MAPVVVTEPVISAGKTVIVIVFPAPDVLTPCVPPPGVTTFKTLTAGTAVPESVT